MYSRRLVSQDDNPDSDPPADGYLNITWTSDSSTPMIGANIFHIEAYYHYWTSEDNCLVKDHDHALPDFAVECLPIYLEKIKDLTFHDMAPLPPPPTQQNMDLLVHILHNLNSYLDRLTDAIWNDWHGIQSIHQANGNAIPKNPNLKEFFFDQDMQEFLNEEQEQTIMPTNKEQLRNQMRIDQIWILSPSSEEDIQLGQFFLDFDWSEDPDQPIEQEHGLGALFHSDKTAIREFSSSYLAR